MRDNWSGITGKWVSIPLGDIDINLGTSVIGGRNFSEIKLFFVLYTISVSLDSPFSRILCVLFLRGITLQVEGTVTLITLLEHSTPIGARGQQGKGRVAADAVREVLEDIESCRQTSEVCHKMVSEPSDDGPRASISEIEALAINFNLKKTCCKLSLIASDLRCSLKWQTYNNKWVQLYLNCGEFRMIVVQPTYNLFMLILDLAPNFHVQKLDLDKQMFPGWKLGSSSLTNGSSPWVIRPKIWFSTLWWCSRPNAMGLQRWALLSYKWNLWSWEGSYCCPSFRRRCTNVVLI